MPEKKKLTAVIRQKRSGFQATCLETGTYGEGETKGEAFDELVKATNEQLRLLSYPGIDPIRSLRKSDFRLKRGRKIP